MKQRNLVLLAVAMFGCTLLFSACEKKEDQTPPPPPPSSTDTSQAPSDKGTPDQSTPSPSTGSSTDSGTPQKTDDSNKADKG